MKSSTLRHFSTLHTWTGLIAGFALFVAFYCGAITVFHEDLHHWQSPEHRHTAQAVTTDELPALIDGMVRKHPQAAADFFVQLPSPSAPSPVAYWKEDGEWTHAPLRVAAGLEDEVPHSGLADLINSLHFSLGLPVAGIYVMGIVSMMYGVALVSGVLIHLPLLLRDLFALRPGRNLKRFWQDAHNAIGVCSLPFHIVFAISGALLCLSAVLIALMNVPVFGGELPLEIRRATRVSTGADASGEASPMQSPAALVTAARAAAPEFEPKWLRYYQYGDRAAQVEVRGTSPRALAVSGGVALEAATARVLNVQTGGRNDANHAAYAGLYALHFGSYGGAIVQGLYGLLGLAGAFLFFSGNLLWIEARRKRQQVAQPTHLVRMAQATIGVCVGCCAAVSAAFVATQIAAAMPGADRELIEKSACFGVFFAALAWSFARPPSRAAFELLLLTAALTAAIPLSHGALTGDHLLRSALLGDWVLLGIDLCALLMAAGYVWLAALTRKRALDGDPNSVWAAPTDGTQPMRQAI